jgi:hypothetical protein
MDNCFGGLLDLPVILQTSMYFRGVWEQRIISGHVLKRGVENTCFFLSVIHT